MKCVYKYPLQIMPRFDIEIPVGAKALTVQLQGRTPTLWAEVHSDNNEMAFVTIYMVGTGHELPPNAENYLGTVQLDGFVWHFYHGTYLILRSGR